MAGNVPRQYEEAAWMDEALCKGKSAIFFPIRSAITGIGDPTASAKAICQRCPVRVECLDYALRHNQTWGVWGGCSERERKKLRRQRRRAA